ncbi:DUF1254 domain-containing protein [Mumia sp. DW29H23]|uniref:DUF1254 domain-containing protein n=1 Tax=Mumia sp. DW29H23 TaxID=3421241 RepID=UPI003D681238
MADLETAATEAYVYAFPLVFDLDQVNRFVTTGVGANPAAPFNTFSHARTLAGPADTFVSINNDTVYSMAQVDLSVGPVLLTVPPTGGRYHVLQLVDAWTNNFGYIGRRATGVDGGEFLLVPPDWDGPSPAGATVVRFPTRIASIVGRWAVDGPDDLPAVHALQDATTLTPLLRSLAPPDGLPGTTETGDEALDFWERYRVWSQAFPPARRDVALQESFAPLGLTGSMPVSSLSTEQQAALRAGFALGRTTLEKILTSGSIPEVNGWRMTLHVFDYSLDFFEVGALDDPAWKIADPQTRIGERAAAALGGLWGNHGYEAAYLMTYVDGDGRPLDGAHTYTLRLAPPPPVAGFWSVTMYDVPDYFLVDNPISRYSIGDRTPGLVHDADGGITLTLAHEAPEDPTARANWLPTPPGRFRPLLRMYVPSGDVLDGTWEVPPVVRADPA